MKILLASSEAVPFARTGQVADGAGGRSRALAQLGHEVILLLPNYRQVGEKRVCLDKTGVILQIPISQRVEPAELFGAEWAPRFQVLFVRHDRYYDRDYLYGPPNGDFEDNAERFIFFSRSVLEAAQAMNLKPDIIHCHDWQTGLVPVYLRTLYRTVPSLRPAASVFTVHNIASQGLFWHYDMEMTNLGWELFTPQALEFYGKINFLKGGIVFADAVTTVGRVYAEEIQTPEYGCGLDGVLRDRRADLFGIPSGVDDAEWNPLRDPFIGAKYDSSNLQGKKICKADLQREFGLPGREDIPLIGTISRPTEQKGFDLLSSVMEELIALHVQFVLLGVGAGESQFLFAELSRKYPEQVSVRMAFNNEVAHRIEAGADMLLLPWRFEPYGPTEIYSLKYGTVPIVRDAGGLDETVEDFNLLTGQGNGFKFKEDSPSCLLQTIKMALQTYQRGEIWERLMVQGMSADFSWEKSARAYLKVYEQVLAGKQLRSTRP